MLDNLNKANEREGKLGDLESRAEQLQEQVSTKTLCYYYFFIFFFILIFYVRKVTSSCLFFSLASVRAFILVLGSGRPVNTLILFPGLVNKSFLIPSRKHRIEVYKYTVDLELMCILIFLLTGLVKEHNSFRGEIN